MQGAYKQAAEKNWSPRFDSTNAFRGDEAVPAPISDETWEPSPRVATRRCHQRVRTTGGAPVSDPASVRCSANGAGPEAGAPEAVSRCGIRPRQQRLGDWHIECTSL